MALTRIGASTIVSITDDSVNARALNRVYEVSLRNILSECLWTFATKRQLLSLSADPLDWYETNESYIYIRPANCIRIFSTNSPTAVWREEGDYIIADVSGLGIRYVQYLDVPTKYSISFADAFADKLASDIAFLILNQASMAREMLEKYEKVSLPKARAENAQTGTHQYLQDDMWENSKYSNSTTD